MRIIFLICFGSLMALSALAKDKPLYKTVADHWAAVPAGILKLVSKNHDKVYEGKTYKGLQKDSFQISNFWISKTEITNFEYLEFIESIKKSGDLNKLKKVIPDTLVWRTKLSYNEPYVEYYFRHPAYRNYPVVGITHEQALLYCEWLTDIYNKKLKELFPKIAANKILVKLPSTTEWMWAARGGLDVCIYPWAGPYLRSSRKGFEVDYQCNFRKISEGSISYNSATGQPELKEFEGEYLGVAGLFDDNANITAPVFAYWPNGYGLYNMAGNVAEMTSTPGIAKGGSWFTCGYDVQIEAPDPFEGNLEANAYVGFRPIFMVIE